MKTPILGSAYVARSVNAADSRMVNLFPEIVPEGGKEPAFLQRVPGLNALARVGGSIFTFSAILGMWVVGDYLYVVSGNKLYKCNSSFLTITELGTMDVSNVTETVSMANNDVGQLFVACNGPSYVYDTVAGTFTTLTPGPTFPGAGMVAYIDGFFVVNQPNTQNLFVSKYQDGTVWDLTKFGVAEGSPDNIVGIIVDHRELWVFGETTTEVWYNVGNAGFPLAPIQGAFSEIGCASASSIAKLDNAVFWLSRDARGQGIVYRARGYSGERVSTHSVEWQIQQAPAGYPTSDLSSACAYTYQQDGHGFYVLNIPNHSTTWVYDVATQAWHERQTFLNGTYYPYYGVCQAFFAGYNIIGGNTVGVDSEKLYKIDLDRYEVYNTPLLEANRIIKWIRSWRALPSDGNNLKRTAHHSLQLDCESGVGIDGLPPDASLENAGPGTDPQVMLRWSDDGGHTWSNEHWAAMGRIGQYGRRVIWRRLGMTMKLRDRVYEVSGTDPIKVFIMGAELQATGTNA